MNKTLLFAIMGGVLLITTALVVFVIIKNNKSYVVVEDEVIEDDIKKVKKYKKTNLTDNLLSRFEDDKDEATNSNGLINYNIYNMTAKEKRKWALMAMGITFIASYIFYRSIIWSGLFCLVGVKFPELKKKDLIKKRKQKLLLQFKEALYVISTSLSAGKSVENAFIDAHGDLESVFDFGDENYILEELACINRRIKMNQTIEDSLEDFANRSGLEDIRTFANVFVSCKTTGGNLKSVTEMTSNIIGEKITIKQDIETLVAGKKFEANILGVIPFGILIVVNSTAPEFVQGLYTIPGRLLSTVALGIIAIAVLWARKIMSIEV